MNVPALCASSLVVALALSACGGRDDHAPDPADSAAKA